MAGVRLTRIRRADGPTVEEFRSWGVLANSQVSWTFTAFGEDEEFRRYSFGYNAKKREFTVRRLARYEGDDLHEHQLSMLPPTFIPERTGENLREIFRSLLADSEIALCTRQSILIGSTS